MQLQVALHIAVEAARALHRLAPENRASRELVRIARRLGVDLAPLFPGARDDEARSQFVVGVPDVETARRVITALKSSDATEAAYLTPPSELPGAVGRP